jgi:glycosyltransferase involved in cell wall biosynthesis/SAM-dependent methyltransferase
MSRPPGTASGPDLVSVVVGLRDAESFLREAIDSVFAQTHERWELLLVGDGSTGTSMTIAGTFAERYPGRVSYVHHHGDAGLGTGALRSLGLEHAQGQFVAFLDADGVWLPHKLERQLDVMRAHPEVGVVYGTAQLWYSWSGDPRDTGRDLAPDLGVELGVPIDGRALLADVLRRTIRPPRVASLLARRELVPSLGEEASAFRDAHADLPLVAALCLETFFLASGECWERCRRRDRSDSPTVEAADSQRVRRHFLEWLDARLLAHGIEAPRVREAVQSELRCDGSPRPARRMRRLARSLTPVSTRRWMRARWRGLPDPPPAGRVEFGDLRRLTPMSRRWGKDRGGRPIDRYYIEGFLAAQAGDIHGRVLEVGDDAYARRFGGDGVSRRDVLHPVPGNPKATIVADLARDTSQLTPAMFDCVILTQVLHVMADPEAAVHTTHRILRPGGVVLATLAGISQVSRWDMERWGDYWRFTTASARRLFGSVFPLDHVGVESHGNVLTAIAFLHGLTADEMRPPELDHLDPDYQLLITVRAVKPRATARRGAAIDEASPGALVPSPWR